MPRVGGYFNTNERLSKPEVIVPYHVTTYSEAYKDTVFTIWYSHGKPKARYLYSLIPEDQESGGKPGLNQINKWINTFKERAITLDAEVSAQLSQKLVAEKVEMLQRHAKIGKEVTDMAVKYLKENEDKLTIGASTRLLVAGIEIERESRGIATTVEKIAKMSDEQLEDEIKRLLLNAPMELEPNEDELDQGSDAVEE